ncbi:MurR/RpiR family transcriptional regulator [Paenibacillus sp. FSL M7-1455]|uniref:N-acetylmannosamine kinase n=1 Tax=Paenibacillus cookii TaxID=157839 RepID=A0ABQ4LSU3_9BACL|nr:MurR/RpiR family transcriptional regulator [Paenibacillus cookii]KHF32797.1 putative HTH-type transcriptional regulator YbbH [Paenibacillus sp. P1XP2]GIO66334.1 N-acetylmannosamine kinase [Paenibacillus cookii]HWO55100.1 MurR/RpiR family transcriptional regulator [Paenibacillus cookii]
MPGAQEMGKTLLSIRSHLNGLTKTEQKVAHYILENAQDLIYDSVTELAEKAEVGETTVLRFCRKMKFQGFQDFKLSLAQDLVKPTDHIHEEIAEDDDPLTLSQKIIGTHLRTLEQTRELVSEEQLTQAIDALAEAANVHFFGVGSSGLTAAQGAHSFARIGKNSMASSDTHFQAMQASLMNKGDVAVGLSISGSTKDTIDNLNIAKKAGARIIAVTSNARSPITKIADIVLIVVGRENPLQGSSLAAKMSQLAIIDILNVAVSLRMKDQAIKYREITAKATSDKLY